MTRKMNIQTRLIACFALVLATAGANAVHSSIALRGIRNHLDAEIATSVKMLDDSRQITIGIANMRSAMRGVTLFSLQNNTAQFDKAKSSFETTANQMRKTLDQMAAVGLTEEDRATVTTIRTGLDRWVVNFQHFSELCASGHGTEANEFVLRTTSPIMDTLQKTASESGRVSSLRQENGARAAGAAIDRSEFFNFVFGLIVLVIGGGALAVVAGLVRSLKRITRSLLSSALQVAGAAAQVSSASESLSQGSSEQAASLEETSASTEEINSMAKKNTDNLLATAAIVTESGRKFDLTNQALSDMLSAMEEINTSSGRISRVIKVIDEIAFQTNILALNAAVEAARAGEAGMGFAVVADEVRNLARRSAQAAKDTASLIEESIAKSRDGKASVDGMAKAIHEITEAAARTRSLVDEVSVGTQEQTRGIEQISRAIAQMEQVTQQTAAAAEQGAAASEELSSESQAMHNLAAELAAMVGGS